MAERIQLYEQAKDGSQKQVNLITDIGSVYKPNNSGALGSKSAQIYSGANTQENLLSILGKINDWFSDIIPIRNKTVYTSGNVKDTDLALQKNVNSKEASLLSQIQDLSNNLIKVQNKLSERIDTNYSLFNDRIREIYGNELVCRMRVTYITASKPARITFKSTGETGSAYVNPVYPVIVNTATSGIYHLGATVSGGLGFYLIAKGNSPSTSPSLTATVNSYDFPINNSLKDASFIFTMPRDCTFLYFEKDCEIINNYHLLYNVSVSPGGDYATIPGEWGGSGPGYMTEEELDSTFIEVILVSHSGSSAYTVGKLLISYAERNNDENGVISSFNGWKTYIEVNHATGRVPTGGLSQCFRISLLTTAPSYSQYTLEINKYTI